jgi:hypothetical protein
VTLKHLSRMIVIAAAALAAACNSSSESPTGPSGTASTTYQGTVAGFGGRSGTIDITVQNGAPASGTLRLAGAAATTLTGTYDSAARSVQLSGGGMTLTGTVSANVLSGTVSGASSGAFSTLSAADGPVTRYCGTYTTSIIGYTETGTWNIQISSTGVVSGVHAAVTPAVECCGHVTGKREGNTVTFTTEENKTVVGTIQGNTLSGSQPNGSGTTSFSGTTDACQ